MNGGAFLAKPLNGGTWSEQEEMYAAALIEAFKAGELPDSDIDEGTSLRKYLAKKLMCSPKRVSKKFEGTGYNGKQVYFKKDRTKFLPNPVIDAAKLSTLQQLERNFLLALTETQAAEAAGMAKSSQARIPAFHTVSNEIPFFPNSRHPSTVAPVISPTADAALPRTSRLDESSVAALQARAELSALIQQRDMLNEILSKAELQAPAASSAPQALHTNTAPGSVVEMMLAADTTLSRGPRIPGERRLQTDHLQQTSSLASSLAQHRVANLTTGSALPNSIDYQTLLQSSMATADLSSLVGLASTRQQATQPGVQHGSPLTYPKRALVVADERSGKQARLPSL